MQNLVALELLLLVLPVKGRGEKKFTACELRHKLPPTPPRVNLRFGWYRVRNTTVEASPRRADLGPRREFVFYGKTAPIRVPRFQTYLRRVFWLLMEPIPDQN